jgi:hypothetical protein
MRFHQAHLYGEITVDGTAMIRVTIKSNISMSHIPIDEVFKYTSQEIDLSCGPLTFEVFVFFKDQRLYRSLDIDRKVFDDLLSSYSGVKIYRDGFRILPFGDTNNDWLELNSARTASPEHRIATNNAIGVVYITRDNNPGLEDVLSRENMYVTPQYMALKGFVNEAFEKYTSIQLSSRKKADKDRTEQGKAALRDAQKSISSLSRSVGTFQQNMAKIESTDDPKLKEEILSYASKSLVDVVTATETSLKAVKAAYTYYKLQDDFKSREMQIYRNIATLGISAAMFGHEALNQTVDAKAICMDVKHTFSTLLSTEVDLNKKIEKLHKDVMLIDEKASFFRNYLRREKQDRARYINIYDALLSAMNQYAKAFEAIDVIVQVDSAS